MADVPESKEVTFHHFRTEMTKLEREALEKFRAENLTRWTRVGELDGLWAGLQSHESIDRAWLDEWRERTMSILRGDAHSD